MKRQFLRIVTASLLTVLLAALSSFSVHADDFTYFNRLSACDNDYYGTLGYYQSQPNYPISPTRDDSLWAAYNDYYGCTLRLPEPSFAMDFCANARAARDNCMYAYLDTGDFDTYYACNSASGIGHCE